MGKRVNPTLVGAFVLGALVLAVVGVAVFGSGRLFRHTVPFVLYFDSSVNGLRIGAPVKFKGVEIGAVTGIELSLSQGLQRPGEVHIPVLIELDPQRIHERGGYVILNREGVDAAIESGLRGQLATESFVTGVLYIELDFHPGSPVKLINEPGVKIFEIPTLPTALEQVQTKAVEIINKLGEIDFHHIVDSFSQTIDGANAIVNSPGLKGAVAQLDGTVTHVNETFGSVKKLSDDLDAHVEPAATDLRSTAEHAQAALDRVRTQLEPGAPLAYQLGHTLADVSEAARAVQALAEELQRNPSALVRGKPVPEGGK